MSSISESSRVSPWLSDRCLNRGQYAEPCSGANRRGAFSLVVRFDFMLLGISRRLARFGVLMLGFVIFLTSLEVFEVTHFWIEHFGVEFFFTRTLVEFIVGA